MQLGRDSDLSMIGFHDLLHNGKARPRADLAAGLGLVRAKDLLEDTGQVLGRDADAGVIAFLDEERDVITYPYLHNMPLELAEVTLPRGAGLAGQVMVSGHPTVVEDYASYPEAVEAFVRAGLASVVAVPIVSGDRVFGALLVFSLKKR